MKNNKSGARALFIAFILCGVTLACNGQTQKSSTEACLTKESFETLKDFVIENATIEKKHDMEITGWEKKDSVPLTLIVKEKDLPGRKTAYFGSFEMYLTNNKYVHATNTYIHITNAATSEKFWVFNIQEGIEVDYEHTKFDKKAQQTYEGYFCQITQDMKKLSPGFIRGAKGSKIHFLYPKEMEELPICFSETPYGIIESKVLGSKDFDITFSTYRVNPEDIFACPSCLEGGELIVLGQKVKKLVPDTTGLNKTREDLKHQSYTLVVELEKENTLVVDLSFENNEQNQKIVDGVLSSLRFERNKNHNNTSAVLKDAANHFMAADIYETIRFYTKNLGFKLVNVTSRGTSTPGKEVLYGAKVRKDDVEIRFQTRKSMEREFPFVANATIGASVISYIKIENIEIFYEQIKKKVEIVRELSGGDWDEKTFYIRDNNGYILGFYEPIS